MYAYLIILLGVLLLSPLIIKIAAKQDNKTKLKLRGIFLTILSLQILSGFLNWQNFGGNGKSGYQLSLDYPSSLLGLFFTISAIQFFLLLTKFPKSVVISVILNFVNSILILAGLIRLSSIVDSQLVSLASISAVFLVLTGNVVALAYVNRDRNLLKKYNF